MQKQIITLIILFAAFTSAAAASDSLTYMQLQQKVKQMQTELKNQKNDFSRQQSEMNKKINALRSDIAKEQKSLTALSDSLGIQIANTQINAEQKIYNVQQTVSKNTLYWVIAVLTIALLSFVLFWFLHRKQKLDKTDLIAQLSQTKSSIEESLVKEFDKQTELMDTQMEFIAQQKENTSNNEPDHSLALKVASEINTIERNINLMNPETRGLKQLFRSMEKLKDNLSANGYEIPPLLGKKFHQGMKVIVVNSIPNENLEKDSEIITKVLIPQVNHNGIMIQTAQIEVSIGI